MLTNQGKKRPEIISMKLIVSHKAEKEALAQAISIWSQQEPETVPSDGQEIFATRKICLHHAEKIGKAF